MRSGRLSRRKGLLGQLIHLKPVITIDPDGKVAEAAKAIGRTQVVRKTVQLSKTFADTVQNPQFNIGHVLAPKTAQNHKLQLQRHFAYVNPWITEASPALGLHTGIGSSAIAVMGDPV